MTTLTAASSISEIAEYLLTNTANVTPEAAVELLAKIQDKPTFEKVLLLSAASAGSNKKQIDDLIKKLGLNPGPDWEVNGTMNFSVYAMIGHMIFLIPAYKFTTLFTRYHAIYKRKMGGAASIQEFGVSGTIPSKSTRTEILRQWATRLEGVSTRKLENIIQARSDLVLLPTNLGYAAWFLSILTLPFRKAVAAAKALFLNRVSMLVLLAALAYQYPSAALAILRFLWRIMVTLWNVLAPRRAKTVANSTISLAQTALGPVLSSSSEILSSVLKGIEIPSTPVEALGKATNFATVTFEKLKEASTEFLGSFLEEEELEEVAEQVEASTPEMDEEGLNSFMDELVAQEASQEADAASKYEEEIKTSWTTEEDEETAVGSASSRIAEQAPDQEAQLDTAVALVKGKEEAFPLEEEATESEGKIPEDILAL